jgi:hypothetical protein
MRETVWALSWRLRWNLWSVAIWFVSTPLWHLLGRPRDPDAPPPLGADTPDDDLPF